MYCRQMKYKDITRAIMADITTDFVLAHQICLKPANATPIP
jgi:hypothetical protein